MTGIGRRREARERSFGLLYEAEAKSEAPATVLAGLPVEPDPYAARLVLGVDTRLDEIDALISRFARGWKLERMPAVDRAVVRVAVYELLGEPTVPTAVVVSEAGRALIASRSAELIALSGPVAPLRIGAAG